jgi:hypothetical protein
MPPVAQDDHDGKKPPGSVGPRLLHGGGKVGRGVSWWHSLSGLCIPPKFIAHRLESLCHRRGIRKRCFHRQRLPLRQRIHLRRESVELQFVLGPKLARQALARAVNKPQLVTALFKDLASPAYAPMSPVSWAYTDELQKFEYSPTRAAELLQEAGYSLNKKGVLEKEGRPFIFKILVNQGNRDRERAAIIIKEYLKRIGIVAEIQVDKPLPGKVATLHAPAAAGSGRLQAADESHPLRLRRKR